MLLARRKDLRKEPILAIGSSVREAATRWTLLAPAALPAGKAAGLDHMLT
jgi:hypothetical protein